MAYDPYSRLKGTHAVLSPSNYHWINYDDEKMASVTRNRLATEKGTRFHSLAAELIALKVKLPRKQETLNLYVNDCINYAMEPEVMVYHSEYCYGCMDAHSFNGKVLRIFDLKTGETATRMEQLLIYAALYCIQHHLDPRSIEIILRKYQYCTYEEYRPTGDEIVWYVDRIRTRAAIVKDIYDMEG